MVLHGDASNVFYTLSKGEVVLGVNNLLQEVNPYNIAKEEDTVEDTSLFQNYDTQKRSTTHMINRVVQTVLQFNQLRGIFKQNTTPAQIRNGEATGTIQGNPEEHWADHTEHPIGQGIEFHNEDNAVLMVSGAFYGCSTYQGSRLAYDEKWATIYPISIDGTTITRTGPDFATLKVDVLKRLGEQRYPLPIWSTMEALTTKARDLDNYPWDQLASIGGKWAMRQTIEELSNNQLAHLFTTDFHITGEKPPRTYAKDQFVDPQPFTTMCYEWLSGVDNTHKPDEDPDSDSDENEYIDEALTSHFTISHWAYKQPMTFTVNVGGFIWKAEGYIETMGTQGERVVGCFHSGAKVAEIFSATDTKSVDHTDIIWGNNMDLMGFNPHAFNRDHARFQVHDWMDPKQVAPLVDNSLARLSNADAAQKLGQFRVDPTHTLRRYADGKTVRVDTALYRTDADKYLYDIQRGGSIAHNPAHRVGQIVGTGVVWQSPQHQYEHLQRNYDKFQKTKAKAGNLDALPLSPLTHPYHFVAVGGQVL